MRYKTWVRLGLILPLAAPLACRERTDTPSGAPASAPAGAGVPSSQPAVPEVDLSAFEPEVQDQIREAREAFEAAPEDAEANGRLGMLFNAYKLPGAATICYRRAAHFAPENHRWWHLLGRLQSDTGDSAAAVVSLRRAYEVKSDYLATVLLLGDLAVKNNDIPAAKGWYDKALALDPQSAHALMGAGRVCMQEKNVDEAIQRFTEAVQHAPQFAAAQYALALAYRSKGEMEKANEHLAKHREAVALYPPPDPLLAEVFGLRRDVEYILKPANGLMKAGRYREAIALYYRVLERDPEQLVAAYNVGLAREKLGELEAAAAQFEKVIERWPEFLEARNSLGTCLRRMQRQDDAAVEFREILKIDPAYAKANFNLASIAAERGDVEDAIKNYTAGLKHQPEDFFGQLDCGTLHLRMNNAAAAVPYLQAAVKLRDDSEVAHLRLAAALQATGDTDGAITHYRRCIELNPSSVHLYRGLAGLLKTKRDYAGVVKALRACTDRNEKDRNCRLSLARILATCPDEKIRDPEEALKIVDPIYQGDGANDPRVLDTLATVYADLGRFEDAVKTATFAVQLTAQDPPSPQNEQIMQRMRERLKLYRNRQPYHEQ